MNKHLVYLDLPSIPEELLEPIDVIINKPRKDIIHISSDYDFFQTREVSKELENWISSFLKRECIINYQIVKKGIDIHKDFGRRVAFNYLLDTGGHYASTCFYNEQQQIIDIAIIKPKKWHRLKVDVFHNVKNLHRERVAVSVYIPNYTWDDNL